MIRYGPGVTSPSTGHRVVVLANPGAGGRRHRRLLPVVLERLAIAGTSPQVLPATSAAEAEHACRQAVAEGATALVAVGGDGTVHAALQAVAGTDVPLAIVPTGTGNDLAAALGVPADPVAAAEAVVAGLVAGTTRQVDLARITPADGDDPAGEGADRPARWYGAVLAAGFDAVVNERANRMRWPRGDRRYDLAIFLELVRLPARRYRIGVDGTWLETDAVLVAVGNTSSYGGGIRICPHANPTDGLLDVVVGAAMPRRTLVRLRPAAYRGTHVDHPLVSSYRARTVTLAADGIVGYADGERCLPLPITVTCHPGALRLLTRPVTDRERAPVAGAGTADG